MRIEAAGFENACDFKEVPYCHIHSHLLLSL